GKQQPRHHGGSHPQQLTYFWARAHHERNSFTTEPRINPLVKIPSRLLQQSATSRQTTPPSRHAEVATPAHRASSPQPPQLPTRSVPPRVKTVPHSVPPPAPRQTRHPTQRCQRQSLGKAESSSPPYGPQQPRLPRRT